MKAIENFHIRTGRRTFERIAKTRDGSEVRYPVQVKQNGSKAESTLNSPVYDCTFRRRSPFRAGEENKLFIAWPGSVEDLFVVMRLVERARRELHLLSP